MEFIKLQEKQLGKKPKKLNTHSFFVQYQSRVLIPQYLYIICHGVNDSSLAVQKDHDKEYFQDKKKRRKDVLPNVLFTKKAQGFLTALGKIVDVNLANAHSQQRFNKRHNQRKYNECTKSTKIQQDTKVGEDLANVRSHIRAVNPLHPNISVHILHTVLYTFPEAV